MRVLHVGAGNLFGGIETLLITLARCRALPPRMDPHFALCFEGRLSAKLRACGAPVHLLGNVRISRPWTVWAARRRFRALLQMHAFDAVVFHGCWQHALFAAAARARGLPLVFCAHNFQSGRDWLDRWARRTQPDLVISNSRATQASITNLFPNARNELCYYPVRPPERLDRAGAREKVRRDLGTPRDAVVVIQTCRLERWKGHGLLLRALAGLADEHGWVCWLVGGAQRAQERAYLAELLESVEAFRIADRVHFLGQRSDVHELLAAADIHCQPNTGPEPFGIAFVEALYAGLPVVTTALGGALEIVDESCGVLVPEGDADALAAALRRLITDSAARARLGRAGPARAATLCGPPAALDCLGRLLQRLAAEKRPVAAKLPSLSPRS
jgi:glycosyltransferase involved in cell wall biosynthesis